MARKPSTPSIQEQIEEIREQVAEIREATVDEDGKKSLPPGMLQRGVEDLARLVGVADPRKAWETTKDVGRAFLPAPIEALARAKLRGEDYEDAKAKAEESREGVENRRPGVYNTGVAAQSALGMLAGVAIYAKLAGGGNAPAPASAPAPAPAGSMTKAQLVESYTKQFGAAPTAAVARTKATLQNAIGAAPKAVTSAPRAPMLRSVGKVGLLLAAGAAVGSFMTSAARESASKPAPSPAPSPAPAPKPAPAPAAAPVTSYQRTYKSGPKAGTSETVTKR